jgi:hypothetical protein
MRKLVRGLRQGLSEEERYQIAYDVVQRLQQHGDPWRLSEKLPSTSSHVDRPVLFASFLI